jgi:outer membrane lipoprotein-sorting protein
MTNFQMDFTISGPQPGSGHIWFMQNKMKMRMIQGSETTVVIVDRLTRNMQMYSETTKQGMVLPYQEQETPADDAMEIMGYNPRVLGTETVDSKLCTVIEYNDPEQSLAVVKAWVWNQYGFPIKMEITSGGQKITYLYQNITFNTVTATDFIIPADIKMMTGLPTIPGI